MHLHRARITALALSSLAACEVARHDSRAPAAESGASRSAPVAPLLVAGGETSEFSGGNVTADFCPVVTSRTSLDVSSQDVAPWVALVQGQHEIPLRWRRQFPDDRVRGFEEQTRLLLDVQVIAAEEVVCESEPGDTGVETSGYRSRLRRVELDIEFASADGAVRGAFQRPFVMTSYPPGERHVYGGERFPIEELQGTLELGVDPGLVTESQTVALSLDFADQAVSGSINPVVILPGYLQGGGRPSWTPVSGTFPAPEEGCDVGAAVPLDDYLDVLGAAPRAAYELARSKFAAQPITAAWEDTSRLPASLTWTEVNVRPGAPTHACVHGESVDIYTSVRIESADGLLLAEPPVVANVSLHSQAVNQVPSLGYVTLHTLGRWVPRVDFEATAGLRDLDLGAAEYGTFYLYQSFDSDANQLDGYASVRKWENHVEGDVERPALVWCAGSRCEGFWCTRTAQDEASCR